jgi:hypothetical protein
LKSSTLLYFDIISSHHQKTLLEKQSNWNLAYTLYLKYVLLAMHGEGSNSTSGCVITSEDAPRVMASFSIYCAIFGRGICVGLLAAAIPALAEGKFYLS